MSKVIIFPTDTVYGIGASIFDKEGQARIYDIKHRDKSKPLAVLCASLNQIEEIAIVNIKAKKLIQRFLPGALTLILPAKDKVKDIMGIPTIGVRIPNSKLALKILTENGAMATTSVNESGEKPLDTYEEIKAVYGNLVDEIYEKEEESSHISSTVVSLIGDDVKLLREGSITLKEIENYLK